MATAENLGFWEFNRRNGLSGKSSHYEELPDGRLLLVKDPDNPAVLEDDQIAYCLRTSRQARYDFCRLFPTMLPEEQERLANLIEANPRETALVMDSQDFADALQHDEVTEGVRTRFKGRVPVERPYHGLEVLP